MNYIILNILPEPINNKPLINNAWLQIKITTAKCFCCSYFKFVNETIALMVLRLVSIIAGTLSTIEGLLGSTGEFVSCSISYKYFPLTNTKINNYLKLYIKTQICIL